jgi:ribosomal protein L11 methyltransferase
MYHLVTITASAELTEILIAELGELSFEAFEEIENGVLAYVQSELYYEQSIRDLQENYAFSYTVEEVEQQNWNAQWESNYEHVIVADTCLIKSSFHQIEKKYPYEILINPKMSFGTGHHETTTLMLEHLLAIDCVGKDVLDAGCGTGILAILAYQRGAGKVEGFDIEEWAVENAQENAMLNNCPNLKIWLGTIETVAPETQYDILIANIQRNVLLAEMAQYAQHLRKGGTLLLSGFYQKDIDDLVACAQENGLTYQHHKTKNDWVAMALTRI